MSSVEYHDDLYKKKFWLELQYSVKSKSQTEIAEIFGVSQRTIKYWMDKHNIQSRGPAGSDQPDFDLDKCISLYKSGLGVRRVAERVDASRKNVEMHNSGERKKTNKLVEESVRLYKNGMTEKEISDELDINIAQSTVSKWLLDEGVETRNEAGFGQVCYSDGGIKVKSRLEQKTANWLEENVESFEYEPDIEGTRYIPDFAVGEYIIEVWGITGSDEYDVRRKDKVEEYESLGYNVVSVDPEFGSIEDQCSILTEVSGQYE